MIESSDVDDLAYWMPAEAKKLIDLKLGPFDSEYNGKFVGLEDREAFIGTQSNELAIHTRFLATPFS